MQTKADRIYVGMVGDLYETKYKFTARFAERTPKVERHMNVIIL